MNPTLWPLEAPYRTRSYSPSWSVAWVRTLSVTSWWGCCGDRQDAEDLVQEVFVMAWRNQVQRLGEPMDKAWLFKTGHHLSLHAQRRQALLRRVMGQRIDLRPDVAAPDLADPFVGRLADASGALGPDDGRLVMLVAVHGFRFQEVAAVLNLSEDVARKRWQRVRERLIPLLPPAAATASGPPTPPDRRRARGAFVMNCKTLQYRMIDEPWTIEDDPEARAHLDSCPECRDVLDKEQQVRIALQRMFRPELNEAMMERLLAIPTMTEEELEAGRAERAARWAAASPPSPQERGGWRARTPGPGCGDSRLTTASTPAPPPWHCGVAAFGRCCGGGGVLLVALRPSAVAGPGNGYATVPGGQRDAGWACDGGACDGGHAGGESGLEGTPMVFGEGNPFPLPERVALLDAALRENPPPRLSAQDAAAYAAADARAAAGDAAWAGAAPVDLTGRGLEPGDFCVQPQRGVLLFVVGDSEVPATRRPEAGMKQWVLQLRLAGPGFGRSARLGSSPT